MRPVLIRRRILILFRRKLKRPEGVCDFSSAELKPRLPPMNLRRPGSIPMMNARPERIWKRYARRTKIDSSQTPVVTRDTVEQALATWIGVTVETIRKAAESRPE